jgi:hypothetical protein
MIGKGGLKSSRRCFAISAGTSSRKRSRRLGSITKVNEVRLISFGHEAIGNI